MNPKTLLYYLLHFLHQTFTIFGQKFLKISKRGRGRLLGTKEYTMHNEGPTKRFVSSRSDRQEVTGYNLRGSSGQSIDETRVHIVVQV